MSEKTAAELCEEAIDGWKKTMNEMVPAYCFAGFMYGCLNKKQRKVIDKKLGDDNPIRNYIMQEIRKHFGTACKKCKKQLEVDDKFCPNCGEKV